MMGGRGACAALVPKESARQMMENNPFHIPRLIITHKLTRTKEKEKLKGKETTKRKEARKWRPGPNKKSDTPNLEISD
jgi:hypothetical protein